MNNKRCRLILHQLLILLTVVGVLLLSSCVRNVDISQDPGIPLMPFPIIPYAPPTELVPEKIETPLMEATLANGNGG